MNMNMIIITAAILLVCFWLVMVDSVHKQAKTQWDETKKDFYKEYDAMKTETYQSWQEFRDEVAKDLAAMKKD